MWYGGEGEAIGLDADGGKRRGGIGINGHITKRECSVGGSAAGDGAG